MDLFTSDQLRQALGSRPFRFEAQTGSTNDIARQMALEGAPTGSVVLTEEQLSGRGRFGRAWTAPAGTAILMSVILRPALAEAHLPRLTMVGAVAVAETLKSLPGILPERVSLKWPNDVLLEGRKVAGILPEALWQGESLAAVILGIGFNVRVNFENTPLADSAISIEALTGQVDRSALLVQLLRRIDYWSMRVGESSLLATWTEMLGTLGRVITVRGSGGDLTGTAISVDESGALLLQTSDGIVHPVTSGEVTLVG